ncbi:molybdenum cofactor cytidylyltransferase [Klenkia soli]|uniref:Molybdenum cofactor cytidylyltransferase n=1 Tax=Klenkia soli TaxID=1052260 RepID=A0A1H0E3F7_9ACTN|nr:nucleotidyltransferase family protein [Klenkia soli]SDN76915.1 molybdenum cofactor cytidylyltransferase [Klenkia soli]
MSVAALVLAAGGGRRYGMPKALAPLPDGELFVERAVRTARAVCDPVLVVLGAAMVEVWQRADLHGATVVGNRDWETGMASSLRTGIQGLQALGAGIEAAVVMLVDVPGLTPEALARVTAHAAPDALVVPTYDGVPGHPVLIGRDHWAGVADSATGDEGARAYLREHAVTEVDCTGLADPADHDTPRA